MREILTEQPEGTTSTAGKILWGEEILEIHSKEDVGLERGETMKYKAVIFDLDGVICSTDRFHYFAWKKSRMSWGFILMKISIKD